MIGQQQGEGDGFLRSGESSMTLSRRRLRTSTGTAGGAHHLHHKSAQRGEI